MSLHSRSTYKDWGDDEDDDSVSAVKWISPEPNAVLVSGDKLVATWSTPARPIISPSFQLCLVETEECGDTIWPKVKKSSKGQYTITLKIPKLGSDNDFFVRMVDDKGSVYDTPEFKLQGSGSASSALSVNSGASSSSSVLPDSLTSVLPDSGPPGSTTSSADHGGLSEGGPSDSGSSSPGGKGGLQSSNEGSDQEASKNSGKGPGLLVNGTTTKTPGNSTIASTSATMPSLSLTPSITSNALIGSSNDNKPSTAAIVVPLAIFAAALAGLLFSLRQRSKTKEIRGSKNDPSLNRVTSKDSCASGSSSSTNSSGSSRTDLERAIEFITRVRESHSPRLTPLPPSIESRRRERREIRMRQSDASFQTEESPERTSIHSSSSMPDMNQRVRQENRHFPPVPIIEGPDTHDMCPEREFPRSTTYPAFQHCPPGLSQTVTYQIPIPPPTEKSIHPSMQPLGPGSGSRPDPSQTIHFAPSTHMPTSLSCVGMPGPPCIAQSSGYAIPSSVSHPSIAAGSVHHFMSVTPAEAPNSAFPPPPTLPDSLRAALPRPPAAPVPEIVINPSYSECLEPQLQPQPEYEPASQSPTRARPAIPYSTRPQAMPMELQVNTVPNPYDAIARALRTPRLG